MSIIGKSMAVREPIADLEAGFEDIELAALQADFEESCALGTELEVATILGTYAPKFMELGDEAAELAQEMYLQFGEECTLEGIGANLKAFGEKAKEALKELWAKFKELVVRLVTNVNGTIAKFRGLKAKVLGLGDNVTYKNKEQEVSTHFMEDGNDGADIAKAVRLVVKQLTSGKWEVSKKRFDDIIVESEAHWDRYKEAVKANKEKGHEYKASAQDAATTVTEYVKWGDDLVKTLLGQLDQEKIIKAVRIKDLDVEKDAIKPAQAVRRVSRLFSTCIIANARQLAACNKVLGNLKAA